VKSRLESWKELTHDASFGAYGAEILGLLEACCMRRHTTKFVVVQIALK
jgi:hypothetical protein